MAKIENQMRTVFSYFHKSSVYGFHPVGDKAKCPLNRCSAGKTLQCRRCGRDPWAGKTPWRRAWQPLEVFQSAESPWRRAWQPLEVFQSGESPGGGHGSLLELFQSGESPWTEEPGGLSPQRVGHG